ALDCFLRVTDGYVSSWPMRPVGADGWSSAGERNERECRDAEPGGRAVDANDRNAGGGGMTSAARLRANRRNAQMSTGPRSAAGKARAAQNARRHGLAVPAAADPGWAGAIPALARKIAGEGAGAERLALAFRIAAAQIEVLRVRRVRAELTAAALYDR